jgi:predicted TIM-barrel fold metal-dependent hydrolase
MLIVDAQVHMWAANTPERPWVPGLKPHRPEPLGMDELLRQMDEAGVARAVIVPPRIEAGRNDTATDAVLAHPGRFAVMGRLDPKAPDVRERLRHWREQPGMLGLRFTLKHSMESLLTGGHMEVVWQEAEQAGLPLYIAVIQKNSDLVADVAQRFPRLKLVLDHLAIASDKLKDDEAFCDIDRVAALAKFPNVAVKVTAMPCYTTDAYPYRWLHPHLKKVFDAYGPRRCFWGSDLSRLRGSYRECVTMFTEEMPWLLPADLEWIMGRGLCEWINWPV